MASSEARAKVEAVCSGIHLTDAGGWFDDEIREGWSRFSSHRNLAPTAAAMNAMRYWWMQSGVDLFCENLRAYINGRPLHNVIEWQRGY